MRRVIQGGIRRLTRAGNGVLYVPYNGNFQVTSGEGSLANGTSIPIPIATPTPMVGMMTAPDTAYWRNLV